ncbi:MAG: antibiotic biosynthesis monooxygenase [Bacteroidota bacterium]
MRLVQLTLKPGELATAREYYDERTVPALQKTPGCLFAGLLQSAHQPDEIISMTLWESQSHAEAYEKSGLFQQLIEEKRHLLADSSEWRMQLTKELKLEYTPLPVEPTVKSFPVAAMSGQTKPEGTKPDQMFLRIVSLKIKPGKMEEYKNIYMNEIIPAFYETKGCRHAYLTLPSEDSNEAISITIWDSKEAADEYELSGRFAYLLDKVKHTFTNLFQWKMKLEKGKREQSATSDDLRIEGFSVVTGKSFQ